MVDVSFNRLKRNEIILCRGYSIHFIFLLLLIIFTYVAIDVYVSSEVSGALLDQLEIIHNRNNTWNDTKQNDKSKIDRSNFAHQCLNADFNPKNTVGVWTMLNDNMDYVKGAVKLGLGVRAKTKTPLDLVVMELQAKPLGDNMWNLLRPVGYIRCTVDSIKAPARTRPDLIEKFAVIHVWAMEVYETVVFLDADTFVKNSIDDLINMDLKGKPLGVTKDIRDRKWVDTFNSGVMLLHPNIEEHNRLNTLLQSGMKFDYIMSDQGFLNEVYKNNWHEIGFVNNANLALYRFQRKFWDEYALDDINIIHYTMSKPWKCRQKGPYGPICKLWIGASTDI